MSPMMKLKKIVIIDYKMSNLFSVKNALSIFPVEVVISSDYTELKTADAAILPGVGAFKEAMNSLNRLDLISPIHDFISIEKPFLGICLGFQLLFSESFEFGLHRGMGILEGEVLALKKKVSIDKIPHVGWNKVFFVDNRNQTSSFLNGVPNKEHFYFVHSFFVKPLIDEIILTHTTYGDFKFCSAIMKGNLLATQFHPEKSGTVGINFLNNFLKKNRLIGE